jgi:hypothetical protein
LKNYRSFNQNNTSKASGEGNINSKLYKYASKELLLKLLNFLNKVHIAGKHPDEWRNAAVFPMFKRGDKDGPKNYSEIIMPHICYEVN